MSDIKLVVTDIDGTLVQDRAADASAAVHDAMHAVQAAGVTVAAATARPHEMAQELFKKLGFTGPCIFDGGASVRVVETGELLWNNWLSAERLRAIADITAPHSDLVDYFPGLRVTLIDEFHVEDITEPAPYAWCMVDRTALPDVVRRLEALGGLNVHYMRGWPEKPDLLDIQITDSKSDKEHGVHALQQVLSVLPEQTLAIGDGTNDVPLFRAAGIKIAMGNAAPELMELANHTVPAVEEDGWAQAMQRFVLS